MLIPQQPLRIAYVDTSSATWTGGGTYRRNLLEALKLYAPDVCLHIVTDQAPATAAKDDDRPVIQYRPPRGRIGEVARKAVSRWWGYDLGLRQALRHITGGVDVVFPGWLRADGKTAVLGWIPDFQYLHLPEMYTLRQRALLDHKFRQGAERVTLMVLSSHDAEKDFRQFAPQFAHKARVMNFVAHIPDQLYDQDPEVVTTQYHLPKKFFYLPNQFWKHKNHIVVMEALEILRGRDIKPFVVFTGNPVDTRHPAHLGELLEKLSAWGLRDQVALLGLVPHEHVYHFIRQSICVLNPSLFEGWSTTVEECKSVGKRMIISNLSVHREQDPPQAMYFDPHDSDQLAGHIESIWQDGVPGPDQALEAQAREMFDQRMSTFAATFVAIASEAVRMMRG